LRTRKPILIDLTEATSIHRDGLTMLVAAYRQAERTDTQLLLRTGPTQTHAVLGPSESRPKIRADSSKVAAPLDEGDGT
jgi:anti-anti-sigma regulatory factor